MEEVETKLVILRGPSGAGKSTVAKRLFELAADRTVLIEQDHYRFIFKPPGHGNNSGVIRAMIEHNVMVSLRDGYDVILEGILNMKTFAGMFESLFRQHRRNNYLAYFDVPFEETLRRHATRRAGSGFGPEDMKQWYPASGPAGYGFEEVIPRDFTIEQTVQAIRTASGM